MFKKFIHCAPHLPVNNLRETLDYYREKLGFANEWLIGQRDGGISRDDLHLLFEENPEQVQRINSEAGRLALVLFVTHVDAIYQELIERGIPIASELTAHSHGLKEFAFIDINGYYIRIAERLDSI